MAENQPVATACRNVRSWPRDAYDASDEVVGLRLESLADFAS